MRVEEVEGEIEDITVHAGWLYADLFLGLMVIFLATISFVPILSNPAKPQQIGGSASGLITNPFATVERTLVIQVSIEKSFDLVGKVKRFLASEELPLDSQIATLTVIAGYDSNAEDYSQGLSNAIALAVNLRSTYPNLFQNVSTNVDANPGIETGKAALRITFTRIVQASSTTK